MNETHPLGLSTAWNGTRQKQITDLVDEHLSLGFRRLEAYCHFAPEQLAALGRIARERDLQITSLHSPCPLPVGADGSPAYLGDWLASTNESERARAVDAMKRTIDAAAELGATGIVIHLGNTGVHSRQWSILDAVARHGRGSDEHRRLVDEAWREREERKGPHLEAALRSIRTLGEHAEGGPVRLGVEARDGYHEIPSLDEVGDVLAACEGLPVYYWHDAGHGAKLEYAGFVEHEEYLRRYSHRLLGMHVHDTRAGRDHQAPGQGDTDFSMLARYLRPDTIRTLELSATVTPDQIRQAFDVLKAAGFWTSSEEVPTTQRTATPSETACQP